MNTLDQLKSELEHEYKTTKRFFELYPEDQEDYSIHAKSMKMKQLAAHIAEIFAWPAVILTTDTIDFGKGDYKPTVISGRKDLLATLDKDYESGKKALEKAEGADLEPNWSFSNNGQVLAEWSKYGAIRHALNQITHHRAQLGVSYRLLNIPLPSSYGPSAETQRFD
ncbi:MAG: damage-inducible protein DinB [Bacteroidota bacterium]|nr:damage-inducible protein DinB [Bacteroidota bacterium]